MCLGKKEAFCLQRQPRCKNQCRVYSSLYFTDSSGNIPRTWFLHRMMDTRMQTPWLLAAVGVTYFTCELTFRSWVPLFCSVHVFQNLLKLIKLLIYIYIYTWFHLRCWRINLVNALTVISVVWGSNMHGRRESSECGRALIFKVKSLSRCWMLDSGTWQLPWGLHQKHGLPVGFVDSFPPQFRGQGGFQLTPHRASNEWENWPPVADELLEFENDNRLKSKGQGNNRSF